MRRLSCVAMEKLIATIRPYSQHTTAQRIRDCSNKPGHYDFVFERRFTVSNLSLEERSRVSYFELEPAEPESES